MRCVILYQDTVEPVSEAQGFNLAYTAFIVEGEVTTDTFQGNALVPFAASSVQARTAVITQCIQAAAGRGKVVAANDCTVVGAIS